MTLPCINDSTIELSWVGLDKLYIKINIYSDLYIILWCLKGWSSVSISISFQPLSWYVHVKPNNLLVKLFEPWEIKYNLLPKDCWSRTKFISKTTTLSCYAIYQTVSTSCLDLELLDRILNNFRITAHTTKIAPWFHSCLCSEPMIGDGLSLTDSSWSVFFDVHILSNRVKKQERFAKPNIIWKQNSESWSRTMRLCNIL